MFAFLDVNWGGWLAGTGVTLIIYALQNWVPRPSRGLTLSLFIFGTLSLVVGLVLLVAKGPERQSSPTQIPRPEPNAVPPVAAPTAPTSTIPAPTIQDIIPVDTLIKIGVAARDGEAAYSIINMGFASASEVEASLWAVTAAGIHRVHARTLPYLGRGDTVTNEHLRAPFDIGRFVTCVAFTANNRRVERIESFSNENFTAQQRITQPFSHFREPILDVGGTKKLCANMPLSAGSLAPVRVQSRSDQPAGRFCRTVNGRQICE